MMFFGIFKHEHIGRSDGNGTIEQNITRGGAGDAYITRWVADLRVCSVRIHLFHRSDPDTLHDHPWAFWSLILWGGYFEESEVPPGRYTVDYANVATFVPPLQGKSFRDHFVTSTTYDGNFKKTHRVLWRRWCPPGTLLRNKATHKHRVILAEETQVWQKFGTVIDTNVIGMKPGGQAYFQCPGPPIKCLTLCVTGPKVREWGFWCPGGWVPWRRFISKGCE